MFYIERVFRFQTCRHIRPVKTPLPLNVNALPYSESLRTVLVEICVCPRARIPLISTTMVILETSQKGAARDTKIEVRKRNMAKEVEGHRHLSSPSNLSTNPSSFTSTKFQEIKQKARRMHNKNHSIKISHPPPPKKKTFDNTDFRYILHIKITT